MFFFLLISADELFISNICLFQMWYIYRGLEPLVTFNVYSLVFTVLSLGLSIGVVLAVGMLFYFQVCLVTSITLIVLLLSFKLPRNILAKRYI